LARWAHHNLCRNDNFFGFALLDMLRDELEVLEEHLRKQERR